jgi:hypothetical protein
MNLSNVLIVYETEDAARCRLFAYGYPQHVANEVAVYLGQATDLPHFFDDISEAAGRAGLEVEFVELDRLLARLPAYSTRRETTMVWSITDGARYYRGSSVAAISRLAGLARFGAPATAQHLCQDKFASLTLAAAGGLTVTPTKLMEGAAEVAALAKWPSSVRREIVAQANEARQAPGHIDNFRNGAARASIARLSQIDHARDKCGFVAGAETAARPRRVFGARKRLIVLHRHELPARLARGILLHPVDAELIGKAAARIHETDAHVVAGDEGLDKRAVPIALPKTAGALPRLFKRRATRLSAKIPILAPSALGLTKSGLTSDRWGRAGDLFRI